MVAQATLLDPITQGFNMKHEHHQLDASKRRAVKSRQPVANESAQQPNGWNLVTIKEGSKRAKPEAPKFLLLLYEILEVESSLVIRWSQDGGALQILDPVTVTDEILPKYFNHTNFHSFQRQLNYFGFRKWTKSKTDICTFSHPYFRENEPEMLQLIKRKKAPRRTPASGSSSTTSNGNTAAGKKLSPCNKRKMPPGESDSEGFPAQSTGMHIQMNTSGVHIQPAMNGLPLSATTTPHGASSNGALGFSQDGLARHYLPELNNVISPVAATECKKKAKKMDKKDYLASSGLRAPLTSPTDASSSLVNASRSIAGYMPSSSIGSSLSNNSRASSDTGTLQGNGYASAVPTTSHALPTLDIVRSRLIQRQQAGGPEQQQQVCLQQQQPYDYSGFPGFLTPNTQGMGAPMMENHADALASGLRVERTPVQSSVFSNSFSDPVNILLRIKKSRTSSGEGKDVSANHEQVDDQNESLASLHDFLLGNSLYTNQLQARLKLFADENQALKHMLDTKQREVDNLQNEQKSLQQENAVLLEDKNKLFEINRDLLSKLFPQ